MQQTRLESFIESILNIIIGLWVALIAQVVVFPYFGMRIPFSSNLKIAAIFTVISLVRSYVIRRWFNAGMHKLAVAATLRMLQTTRILNGIKILLKTMPRRKFAVLIYLIVVTMLYVTTGVANIIYKFTALELIQVIWILSLVLILNKRVQDIFVKLVDKLFEVKREQGKESS